MRKTLKDVLPVEFLGGEYVNTRAFKMRDVNVTNTHKTGHHWRGTHKNIVVWYELENGYAVGWNENIQRGWSFPVIKL